MNNKIKKLIKTLFSVSLYVFAFIGLMFTGVFFAMKLHLTNVKGSIDSRNQFFQDVKSTEERIKISKDVKYKWEDTPEWQTLKSGLIKDKDLILKVSEEADIDPRILVSSVISEQFRFFTSNRESFKKYFEPLKILGTYTQFSYGISGIKTETAKEIEKNLKDPFSPYYLGKDFENILDYDGYPSEEARLARFTDSHNHYYSYLYTALYLKQIMAQWNKAGFSIDQRPEVLSTLFNLGFNKSTPKENPEVGGSIIKIGEIDYTYGGISYEFYYSNQLTEEFPL